MTAQIIYLIEEAWNRYIANDVLDIHKIRPEVAHSWQRCRNLKVDPYGLSNPEIKGAELKERLNSSQHPSRSHVLSSTTFTASSRGPASR